MAAPRRVAFLLFDQVEVLDFAGPFEAFGVTGWSRPPLPFDVYTVAQSRHPVLARNNLSINPDYDFASCPNRMCSLCRVVQERGARCTMRA